MNIDRLKETITLLKRLDNRLFGMQQYRNAGSDTSQKCGTVGCIVGHATVLDNHENWKQFFVTNNRGEVRFDFTQWSYDFFGFDPVNNKNDQNIWSYLFSSSWGWTDFGGFPVEFNTPKHAMYRINKVLSGYIPGELDDELQKEMDILQEMLQNSEN